MSLQKIKKTSAPSEMAEHLTAIEAIVGPFKASNYLDIVSTLAASALALTALGLSIHYGLHPIGNVVRIVSNFSMRLPLLVTTTTGAAISLFLIMQVARRKVAVSWEIGLGKLFKNIQLGAMVRQLLHPPGMRGKAKSGTEYITLSEGLAKDKTGGYPALIKGHTSLKDLKESLHYNIVEMKSQDGVILRGLWFEYYSGASTAIIFHGNGMVAEDMWEWGNFYQDRGFNVLLMEYRGYGISEGSAGEATQELDAYHDAKAALDFVQNEKRIPLNKILAHGYSLGGAYASILGGYYGVDNVVLSHTFTSLQGIFKDKAKIFTTGSTSSIVYHSYPTSTEDSLKQDGWNNLRKMQMMQKRGVRPFVIEGKSDGLMSPSFGLLLATAEPNESNQITKHPKRKPLPQKETLSNLLTIKGGHYFESFFDGENPSMEEYHKKLDNYLQERELV